MKKDFLLILMRIEPKSQRKRETVANLGLIIALLHHVELGRIEHVVNVNTIGSEDSLARLGRVRLAVDLAVVQVDLVRVVGLEVELPLAHQTLEARLVVDVALDGPDALERVHLVRAAQAASEAAFGGGGATVGGAVIGRVEERCVSAAV